MAKCPHLEEHKENVTLMGVYDCYCNLSKSHLKCRDLLVRYVCTDPSEHMLCPVYKEEHITKERKGDNV